MLRIALVAALVLVPTALADGGPSPGVDQGSYGVLSTNGAVRYVTLQNEPNSFNMDMKRYNGLYRAFDKALRALTRHGLPRDRLMAEQHGHSAAVLSDGTLVLTSASAGVAESRARALVGPRVMGARCVAPPRGRPREGAPSPKEALGGGCLARGSTVRGNR